VYQVGHRDEMVRVDVRELIEASGKLRGGRKRGVPGFTVIATPTESADDQVGEDRSDTRRLHVERRGEVGRSPLAFRVPVHEQESLQGRYRFDRAQDEAPDVVGNGHAEPAGHVL